MNYRDGVIAYSLSVVCNPARFLTFCVHVIRRGYAALATFFLQAVLLRMEFSGSA